jgi:hypothetical protein
MNPANSIHSLGAHFLVYAAQQISCYGAAPCKFWALFSAAKYVNVQFYAFQVSLVFYRL